ncbi:RNA polymerase subunit sigma [Aquimarina aggregata]|uniref:RNA polymerase subunit sigma n=1 Tax=Aquimarina aggregata TaxID=1642818 RepID=A0A163B9N1_9FLAO|nr:sigma-70 family RNA polymerase sigma factor [Aquimarina aggregata]KZS41161.1 RNA polymerase subunit sigma [Aquimarina aggregata]
MINTNKTYDSLLVLRYQSGSKKAFAILVKRWHAKLCKQAYWYTKDIEVSKDIAQDSWRVILLKIKMLKDPNSFGSWALMIVNRKAIDWLRKQNKEQERLRNYTHYCNNVVNDITENDTQEAIIVLRKAINKLPNTQQQVLNLFYTEEYSVRQISEIMGVSTGTIKSRLFTAREKLKSILKSKNHEK